MIGPVGTNWPQAEAEALLPAEGVEISEAPDSARTMESHGVVDQTGEDFPMCDPSQHYMRSIKTGSDMVPWVEQCATCLWVDNRALEQSGHSIIKRSLSERASRIAVSVESEPFAFVQSSREDLTLEEVLGQALGAASVCWENRALLGAGTFDSTRAKAIYEALMCEVGRFQRLALSDAATRAVDEVQRLLNHDGIRPNEHLSEQALTPLRKAVEGGE